MTTATATNNNVNVAETLTADDIVNKGLWKHFYKLSDEQHYKLIMDMGFTGILMNKMNNDQIVNLVKYGTELKSGPLAFLWWMITSGPVENTIAFHTCRPDGSLSIPSALHFMLKNNPEMATRSFTDEVLVRFGYKQVGKNGFKGIVKIED